MARIRTIKPEFWDDEKLSTIKRDARLLFIALWNFADDYGVVKGNPTWLKNKIFPYDEIRQIEFNSWLEDLRKILAIIPFEVNGERYLFIRTFKDHQKVDRPSEKNRNPEPPPDILEINGDLFASENTRRGLDEGSTMAQRGLVAVPGNREQGTGNREQGKKKRTAPLFAPPDFVLAETWDSFVNHRRIIKKPLTETAAELIFSKLRKWKDEGQDPNEILKRSIENGWTGIFQLNDGGGNGSTARSANKALEKTGRTASDGTEYPTDYEFS